MDFIISGSIDDVSLGWMPRMQEYQIPTLDTWTSYIGIIDMLVEDYEAMKPYFMNIASDEALATLYIDFGKDVLADKMGWKSVVILQEDTAFGNAINGLAALKAWVTSSINAGEVASASSHCCMANKVLRLRSSTCGCRGSKPRGGRFRPSPCTPPKRFTKFRLRVIFRHSSGCSKIHTLIIPGTRNNERHTS